MMPFQIKYFLKSLSFYDMYPVTFPDTFFHPPKIFTISNAIATIAKLATRTTIEASMFSKATGG